MCMGGASGCGEQEVDVASGSGWNLWVWLLGVVVRRYIDILILLIPTILGCRNSLWQYIIIVPEGSKVYADLDVFQASSNPPASVPPELCLTPYRRDIVVIGGDMATLLELTVCGDSPHAMQQAQSRKGGREDYLAISSHLQAIGLKSTYHTVEITSLGHSGPTQLLRMP